MRCQGTDNGPTRPDRRGFIAKLTGIFMAGGLLAGYGTFAAIAARFLYPARPEAKGWLFLTQLASMGKGDSMVYQAPSGQTISVARLAEEETVDSFVALSNVCPHLGCKVHWESQNDRFFCPCHNGAFDSVGKAILGPPADANQSLSRFPLKIENGLMFIEVPLTKLPGGPV